MSDDGLACDFRARPTSIAAAIAAPDEMPTGMPSSRATRRAVSKAVWLPTVTTSSIRPRSRIAGTKPAPMPWILCGPGWPPESTGESSGSTATIAQRSGLRGFSTCADAGDRAAGADAGDEDVDLACGVVPDLLGRGAAVDLGIGRVLELLRHDRVRRRGDDLLRLGDRALHALRRRRSAPARRRAAPASCAARSTSFPA